MLLPERPKTKDQSDFKLRNSKSQPNILHLRLEKLSKSVFQLLLEIISGEVLNQRLCLTESRLGSQEVLLIPTFLQHEFLPLKSRY